MEENMKYFRFKQLQGGCNNFLVSNMNNMDIRVDPAVPV